MRSMTRSIAKAARAVVAPDTEVITLTNLTGPASIQGVVDGARRRQTLGVQGRQQRRVRQLPRFCHHRTHEPHTVPAPVQGTVARGQLREDAVFFTGDHPSPIVTQFSATSMTLLWGFPFLVRGALDCGATVINEEMKAAAAHAIARLAHEPGLEVSPSGAPAIFGPDHLIPNPFDQRLILRIKLTHALVPNRG